VISIEIGNSYSRIKGLNPKQERELKALLSYTVGGSSAYFSGYGVRKKSLLGKGGFFPSGLLHRLPAYPTQDFRIKPSIRPKATIKGINPYPWQVDAVKAAIKANRGIITAPTGTGKSLAMALLIAELNVKTLVVVPSLEICKQLADTFKEYGLINVKVLNIDSSTLSNSLFYNIQFDCLIIDEGHHVAAKTYRKLNKEMWKNIYHRYFFTATPFRNDTEETLLFESIAGQVIYKLDYKTAISKGYIVPIEAYYIDLPKIDNDCYTYQEVYKKLVVDNDYRNNLIASLLHKLSDKSTLCLVKEVRHGRILAATSGLQFTNGEDEESREYIRHFNSGGINTLIATTGIMGEGIDTKPCEFVIIAGLGKAKSQLLQNAGRAVRIFPGKESAKIIIFKDRSHKYLLRHFRQQCKIIEEYYGIKVVKLDL